jgi:hypothetical protein
MHHETQDLTKSLNRNSGLSFTNRLAKICDLWNAHGSLLTGFSTLGLYSKSVQMRLKSLLARGLADKSSKLNLKRKI